MLEYQMHSTDMIIKTNRLLLNFKNCHMTDIFFITLTYSLNKYLIKVLLACRINCLSYANFKTN